MNRACHQDPIPAINSKLPILRLLQAAVGLGMDLNLMQMDLLMESHMIGKDLVQLFEFLQAAKRTEYCDYAVSVLKRHISDPDFLNKQSIRNKVDVLKEADASNDLEVRQILRSNLSTVRTVANVNVLVEEFALLRFVKDAIRTTAAALYEAYGQGAANCPELSADGVLEKTRQYIRAELGAV